VQIGTNVPKANIFRFENYWFNHPECIEQIESAWSSHHNSDNSAHIISAKFKNFEEYSSIGQKASQTSLNSLPIAT
jgi:hypothetical protein